MLYTDPVSGHSVCSCQYGAPSSHLLAYQRLASAGLPGLMYGCDSAYLQALQAQAQQPTAPVSPQAQPPTAPVSPQAQPPTAPVSPQAQQPTAPVSPQTQPISDQLPQAQAFRVVAGSVFLSWHGETSCQTAIDDVNCLDDAVFGRFSCSMNKTPFLVWSRI